MFPSTFSIAACEPASGEVGVAVQSKFLAVGAVVPWVSSDAGAVATQAWANASYGPEGLALLRAGRGAEETLADLLRRDEGREHRQAGIVDLRGGRATYTGSACIEAAGGIAGDGFVVQGNCLAGPEVVRAIASGYREATGPLADRLLAALVAGQGAGGDKRGQQSAALVICKPAGGYGGFDDRYVDLRVDDHPAPIGELARILELHKLYRFEPAPEEILTIGEVLGAELARELVRLGRLPLGTTRYDDAAARALVAFMHTENLENRVRADGRIDLQTLGYLRGAPQKLQR